MKSLVISMICIGACIGFGILAPTVPLAYSNYLAIAIMAAFDSIIGAWVGATKNSFDLPIFVSGFFINALIAISFTILGESLNVDIYLAAIFVFVYRIFNNLSAIRRFWLSEFSKKREQYIEK
jgi:small basic protein